MDTVLRGSSKVTERGQITIPQELRHKFNIKPGDQIYFMEEDSKLVILKGPLVLPKEMQQEKK